MEGISGSEIKILSTHEDKLEQRMPIADVQGIQVTVIIACHFLVYNPKESLGTPAPRICFLIPMIQISKALVNSQRNVQLPLKDRS